MSVQSCSSRELGKCAQGEPALVEIWSASHYRARYYDPSVGRLPSEALSDLGLESTSIRTYSTIQSCTLIPMGLSPVI